MIPTRREAMAAVAGSVCSMAGAASARGTAFGADLPQDSRPAGAHQIAPLPFDPSKLDGFSEKLLVSHHANNYSGAVKNLNRVETEIARLPKDSPAFVVGALRERELTFRNSAAYHELYFGNLGGPGSDVGPMRGVLTASFGTYAAFEEAFRAVGMSLAGGSGWATLGFDLRRGSLSCDWSGNHTQASAATIPLLVMDMYEHAYHLDFGAAAAKYVETFFRNVRWEEVARRHAAAVKAAAALRG